MYPFVKKFKDIQLIKLNRALYPKDLIEKIKREEPNSIISLKSNNKYYILELKVDNFKDYFDFLNYLIYLNRK